MILAINAMDNGEYVRHCGGGYEAGGDGGAVLLPCDPFLHQPDVSFLLFDSVVLRAQRGFEGVMQLNLIHNTIFCIKHVEVVNFCRHAGVV